MQFPILVPDRYALATPEDPGYFALRAWITRHCGSASSYLCEGGCQGKAEEWTNIPGTCKYVPLCRRCRNEWQPRPLICKHGHDISRWGRGKSGDCSVCGRLRHHQNGACANCGYVKCRCVWVPSF